MKSWGVGTWVKCRGRTPAREHLGIIFNLEKSKICTGIAQEEQFL